MKNSSLLLLVLLSINSFAQNADVNKVEMADTLYQSGKIYVVVVVLCVIFIGLITYLISLDRKLGKLEKEIKQG